MPLWLTQKKRKKKGYYNVKNNKEKLNDKKKYLF